MIAHLWCRIAGHSWRPDPVFLFGVCRLCGSVKEEPHSFQVAGGEE